MKQKSTEKVRCPSTNKLICKNQKINSRLFLLNIGNIRHNQKKAHKINSSHSAQNTILPQHSVTNSEILKKMPHPVPLYDIGTKVQVYHGQNAAVYPAVIVQRRFHIAGMWYYEIAWEWNSGEIYPNEWVTEQEIFVGGRGRRNRATTQRYSPN